MSHVLFAENVDQVLVLQHGIYELVHLFAFFFLPGNLWLKTATRVTSIRGRISSFPLA
jgi:hypothetical protein